MRRLLDEAIANLNGRAWPVPILRYFRGELTEAALLQTATGLRQQTEVHAFVGLDRLQAGDRTGALPHLQWARDHGTPGSIATDVARPRSPGSNREGYAAGLIVFSPAGETRLRLRCSGGFSADSTGPMGRLRVNSDSRPGSLAT